LLRLSKDLYDTLFDILTRKSMSEYSGEGGETGPPGVDPIFEAARNAVFYRDLRTASETFNMIEALDLILESMRAGTAIDHERLSRLVATFTDDEPQLDAVYDDDGYLIYYDGDGNEVRREAPSPHMAEYFAREKARRRITAEYIKTAAPEYIDHLLTQLDDPANTVGILSVHIERGTKEDEVVSRDELEQATLGLVRNNLQGRGYVVRVVNRRVGADGSPNHPKSELTHTMHTLLVERSQDQTHEL
jgi:hypothetical protein